MCLFILLCCCCSGWRVEAVDKSSYRRTGWEQQLVVQDHDLHVRAASQIINGLFALQDHLFVLEGIRSDQMTDGDLGQWERDEQAGEAGEEAEGHHLAEMQRVHVVARAWAAGRFRHGRRHGRQEGREAAVERERGAGDDAGLHHNVLLAGEGLGGHAAAAHQPRPRADREEAHQARRHVEGRHQADGQPHPHRHEAEHGADEHARRHRTHRHLPPPRRRRLPREKCLHRRLIVFVLLVPAMLMLMLMLMLAAALYGHVAGAEPEMLACSRLRDLRFRSILKPAWPVASNTSIAFFRSHITN